MLHKMATVPKKKTKKKTTESFYKWIKCLWKNKQTKKQSEINMVTLWTVQVCKFTLGNQHIKGTVIENTDNIIIINIQYWFIHTI